MIILFLFHFVVPCNFEKQTNFWKQTNKQQQQDDEDAFDRAHDASFVSACRADFLSLAKLALTDNRGSFMERDSRVTKDDEEQDDEEDANIFGTKARRKQQQQQQQQNQQQQNQQQSGSELGSIGEGSVHSSGSGKKKSAIGLEGANGTLFPPAAGAGAGGSKKKFPLMFPPTATTPAVNSKNAAVPVTPSSVHLGSPSSSTSSSFHMLDSSFSSNFGHSHKMKSGKGEHVCQVLWDALRDNTGLSILNGIDITNNEEVEFSKHLRSYEVCTHIYTFNACIYIYMYIFVFVIFSPTDQ
jgi:hypothetical protein